MLILFKALNVPAEIPFASPGNIYQPIVIVDYTRSDEQYSTAQITTWINKAKPKDAVSLFTPEIFSLDYEAMFTHSGISYGNSMKTHFSARIINPSYSLVNLLNIEQYTSEQNIAALGKPISDILDPQIAFPNGVMVYKDLSGKQIARSFIVFSTPFVFDPTRTSSTLTLKGATFETMVMKLKFAVELKKSQPLLLQLTSILAKEGYIVATLSSSLASRFPVLDRYYAPAPLNDVLSQICLDNNLLFQVFSNVVQFVSASPKDPPPPAIAEKFCFTNSVPNTKIIGSFNPENYANGEFETEAYDPVLFSSVAIYDDTRERYFFSNMSQIKALATVDSGGNKVNAYRFYVMEYTITDSRHKTTVKTKGSNNWLIHNFKLDYMLENAIYKNAL